MFKMISFTVFSLVQLTLALPRDPLNPFGEKTLTLEADAGWIAKTHSNFVSHYNDSISDTYLQRYWENTDNAIDGGPVFIYICGEWTCSPPSVAQVAMDFGI